MAQQGQTVQGSKFSHQGDTLFFCYFIFLYYYFFYCRILFRNFYSALVWQLIIVCSSMFACRREIEWMLMWPPLVPLWLWVWSSSTHKTGMLSDLCITTAIQQCLSITFTCSNKLCHLLCITNPCVAISIAPYSSVNPSVPDRHVHASPLLVTKLLTTSVHPNHIHASP